MSEDLRMNGLGEKMVARWSDPNARPLFKGSLIDGDGCCCAQGDVLRMCGWSDSQLRATEQSKVDREVAALLDISCAHAVLLRIINDRGDGCPQDVIANPERILGDQVLRVLAFWRRLDGLTKEQWAAAVALANARVSRRADAWNASGHAARDAVEAASRAAAWHAAGYAARDAAGYAAGASHEILGASLMPSTLFFLPLFGINDLSDLDA